MLHTNKKPDTRNKIEGDYGLMKDLIKNYRIDNYTIEGFNKFKNDTNDNSLFNFQSTDSDTLKRLYSKIN